MNNSLILISAILISAALGSYLGILFIKLKSRSVLSTLEERNLNITQQLQELKKSYQAEQEKQDLYFNSKFRELSDTIIRIKNERETIRNDKQLLNTNILKYNSWLGRI